MAEHDITLVTAKAASVVIEGMKASLATPAGGLTPATITAMVGIAKGEALQIAPTVTNAMSVLQQHIGLTPNSAGYIPGVSGAGGSASSALTSLTTLQSKLLPAGNHAAFGQILSQAQGHIADSKEIKAATDFISSTDFSDYGSGVSKLSDMATQGLDKIVGSLPSAASAFTCAGPLYNLKDIANFGTPAGLLDKLKSIKLANFSGLTTALTKAGIDIDNLNDPAQADKVNKVLASITDPKIINTIVEQVGITPPKQLSSLLDLTDITKLAPANLISGLTGGLKGIADKCSELGASFANSASASGMITNLQIPNVPNLNTTSLSDHMASVTPYIDTMTGTGSGADGLPNMTDFTQAVAGGPAVAAITSASTLTGTQVSELLASISKTNSLLSVAGIDTTSLPAPSLGTAMSFATSLHKFGEDASGSGIAGVLNNMANSANQYGDAIKLSLIEGKNKAIMAANGISPLKFSQQ